MTKNSHAKDKILLRTPPQRDKTAICDYIKPIHISNQPSNLSNIDCIYVINLDKRPEKWVRVLDLYTKAGLHVQRVSGIDGDILSNTDKKKLTGPYVTNLRCSQLGCLLSHLSVIHDAHARNWDTIWIMEDDVEFIGDIQQIPKRVEELKQFDPQWDILYTDVNMRTHDGSYLVSTSYKPRPDQTVSFKDFLKPRQKVSETLIRIQYRWGCHSMIISKVGINKIFDYFNRLHIWCPIDHDLHYIPNMRQYCCVPDIVTNWSTSPFSDTNVLDNSQASTQAGKSSFFKKININKN